MSVRIGLIGAGDIARKHLDVIRDLNGVEAVGVTSRTMDKAKLLAKDYNIPVCAPDLKTLIQEAKPDALMVLVSFEQMYAVAQEAIACGLPLFLEKPPGLSPTETAHLVALSKAKGIKTMVGYNRRYYSIFHQGLEVIRRHGALMGIKIEGHERFWKLTDLLKPIVRAQWIYANNTHMIDLLRFFGGEIKQIKALSRAHIEENGDQFAALMKFSDGAFGQYLAFWYSPGGWGVTLYGEGVTVEFKPLENGHWMDKQFQVHPFVPDPLDVKYKAGFYQQMRAFVAMVENGVLPWPGLSLEDAYATMCLAEQIKEGV